MQKIFLAIGHRQVEDYIKGNLQREFNFVGETVYREGILKGLTQCNPDILIVRETLEGSSNITEIIYNVRTSFPDIRIIFIAGKRDPGDVLLATLVGYGIWDILTGEKINVKDIINLVRTPNQFINVMHLQPKTTVDERTNKKIFEAPTPVVEKVYIEKQAPVPSERLNMDKKSEDEIEVRVEQKEEPVIEAVQETKSTTITEPRKETPKVFEVETVKQPVKQPEPQKENQKRPLFGRKEKSYEDNFIGKSTKQQIVAFLGSKPGVGNTHVALNTALRLAQRGFKTIYIELNDTGTTIGYVYQIGEYYYGIDTALKAIEEGDYEKVDKALVTTNNLVKNTPKENLMLKNYKKLPDKLDFMFFSEQHIQKKNNKENDVDYSLIKDLCMYLTFQKEYDFIILDAPSKVDNKLTEIAMAYATKIFCTITQDVCSISSNITQLTELSKNRINIKDKIYYILNKYENAILTPKDVEDWVSENVGFKININAYVPNLNKEFIEANYVGLPMLLCTKNRDFVKAFSEIEKTIF